MINLVKIKHTDSIDIVESRIGMIHETAIEYHRLVKDFTIMVDDRLDKRSLDQNAMMWTLLESISKRITVPVIDILTQKLITVALNPDECKDYLSAQFAMETSIASQTRPRLAIVGNGVSVLLGTRTSRMGVKKMSEFIEYLTSYLEGLK